MAELDFEGLSRLLLSQARELLHSWLSGGRVVGHEYCCGSLRGDKGDSFKVNLNTGVWKDFATNEKGGGDLISLYAAISGLDQGAAFKELSDKYNFQQYAEPIVQKTPKPIQVEIIPPPDDEDYSDPALKFSHPQHGAPSAVWFYKDFSAAVLFAIARYDSGKKKQILPWTYNKSGAWRNKGYPAPRPLFGLEYLAHRGNKRILIVEGEKAAVAAREICGDFYVVLTWPNGAQGINRADWSVIPPDMIILLWPDNDGPGLKAMQDVAHLLHQQAKEIKILDPSDKPEGWDAADALMEGMNWDEMKHWGVPRVSEYVEQVTVEVVAENDKAIAAAAVQINLPPPEEAPIVTTSMRTLWDEMGLTLTQSNNPHANLDNACTILDRHAPLDGIAWYDEFYDKIFTKHKTDIVREWSDNDDAILTRYFQGTLGIARMAKDHVALAVTMYAKEHTRNEPRDWMNGLEHDGQDRISRFFEHYFGADFDSYSCKVAMNFWVGMVARIFRPGCKNDYMVVLEGAQGIGKSTAMEIIGDKWYSIASESVQNKDFYQVLKGKMLVEISELDSFGKADVTRIKQVISTAKDTYRASYDRRVLDHPRRSVFVGTTNESTYLRDNTGGRRFWPISCNGMVKMTELKRDRDQLFAQAVTMFKQGDEWHIVPRDQAMEQQESRRQQDDWESVVAEWLKLKDRVTGAEVATDCLKIDLGRIDRPVQNRIGKIMRVLGWRSTVTRDNGLVVRRWIK